MSRLHITLSAIALTIASNVFAAPITIVSVTNASPGAIGFGVADTSFQQASWSQINGYTGADVSAWLFGGFVDGIYVPTSGTAYLTSSLGLDLTQNFIFPDPTGILAAKVLLFSGLNLPAATYFLTLAASDTYGGAWASDLQQPSTIVLASGVTVANEAYAPQANVNPANPPASTFLQVDPVSHTFFEVTGIPVPEPASKFLFGIASVAFLVGRKFLVKPAAVRR